MGALVLGLLVVSGWVFLAQTSPAPQLKNQPRKRCYALPNAPNDLETSEYENTISID